jgi:chaperonin GroES
MKFQPVYDWVVIKPWVTSEVSKGGIYIPHNESEVVVKSDVVAVGEGHFLQSGEVKPLKTKVGDKVVFNKVAAQFTIEEDGEKYYLIHERDIFGIENQ